MLLRLFYYIGDADWQVGRVPAVCLFNVYVLYDYCSQYFVTVKTGNNSQRLDGSVVFRGLYYKQVTIVIYDRNDSGQYYKTTIMIVIDDRQLRL